MQYIAPFIIEHPELESVEVMCVGDFHLGDKYHSPKVLNDIREWVKEKDNRFITIDGDIFNSALKNSVSDVYSDEYTIDECMTLFGEFIDDVTPEKILVCINGNHDERVWNAVGIDPVKYVCKMHNVRYSPGEAFVTLKVGRNKRCKNRHVMYTLYVTHGCGGGRTVGSKVNAVMRLREIAVADVYIQGHVHDPFFKPVTTYQWNSRGDSVVEKKQWFVVSGSCLERGGYAVSKCYPPVCTVSPILTFDGTEKKIMARLEE